MYYLIYTSYAVSNLTDEDLKLLLLKAREENAVHGITGMLYFYCKTFIQLIEGEEHAVKKLYENILADTRHQHALIIKEGKAEARFFPDWTMGYKFLNQNDLDATETSEPLGVINEASVLRLFKISFGE